MSAQSHLKPQGQTYSNYDPSRGMISRELILIKKHFEFRQIETKDKIEIHTRGPFINSVTLLNGSMNLKKDFLYE